MQVYRRACLDSECQSEARSDGSPKSVSLMRACCCCQLASSIDKMWRFAVLVGAVHSDSTASVVSFDIAGTLKQNVGIALPASAVPPPKKAI